jgi:hypothetical protein
MEDFEGDSTMSSSSSSSLSAPATRFLGYFEVSDLISIIQVVSHTVAFLDGVALARGLRGFVFLAGLEPFSAIVLAKFQCGSRFSRSKYVDAALPDAPSP